MEPIVLLIGTVRDAVRLYVRHILFFLVLAALCTGAVLAALTARFLSHFDRYTRLAFVGILFVWLFIAVLKSVWAVSADKLPRWKAVAPSLVNIQGFVLASLHSLLRGVTFYVGLVSIAGMAAGVGAHLGIMHVGMPLLVAVDMGFVDIMLCYLPAFLAIMVLWLCLDIFSSFAHPENPGLFTYRYMHTLVGMFVLLLFPLLFILVRYGHVFSTAMAEAQNGVLGAVIAGFFLYSLFILLACACAYRKILAEGK